MCKKKNNKTASILNVQKMMSNQLMIWLFYNIYIYGFSFYYNLFFHYDIRTIFQLPILIHTLLLKINMTLNCHRGGIFYLTQVQNELLVYFWLNW